MSDSVFAQRTADDDQLEVGLTEPWTRTLAGPVAARGGLLRYGSP
ncbi:hypothetical protein [Micromonospora sp. CPCC 205558]